MKKKAEIEDKEENYMSLGMSFGMCFGVAIGTVVGVFINNIGICMCFGVSIGMCAGMGIGACIKKKGHENETEQK